MDIEGYKWSVLSPCSCDKFSVASGKFPAHFTSFPTVNCFHKKMPQAIFEINIGLSFTQWQFCLDSVAVCGMSESSFGEWNKDVWELKMTWIMANIWELKS